jgi:hypothetical protein
MKHQGSCFCGAVGVEAEGEPQAMGYCHCNSCRSWSGGPINAFTLWQPDKVRVTAGEEKIGTFAKTDFSHREYCTVCGGHLLTRHPTLALVDVCASSIPTFPFKAGVHLNYAETVLPIRDGLPKFKGFPGSETLPE